MSSANAGQVRCAARRAAGSPGLPKRDLGRWYPREGVQVSKISVITAHRPNSSLATPSTKAAHSSGSNVRIGPSGCFESRTWIVPSCRRTSTQSPLSTPDLLAATQSVFMVGTPRSELISGRSGRRSGGTRQAPRAAPGSEHGGQPQRVRGAVQRLLPLDAQPYQAIGILLGALRIRLAGGIA